MPLFPFNADKFRAALHFLAGQGLPEFDKYRAVKLLFLADKRHLVRFGRPIVGGIYRALPHGPAPVDALDAISAAQEGGHEIDGIEFDYGFSYPRIRLRGAAKTEQLSESECEALQECAQEYGRKSFAELRALTHSLPEYERAWADRGPANAAEMRVEDFFEEDPEALPGVKEAMLEDASIREWFEGGRG
ncbi:MAG TPA: Panacea domain-containing protein [Terriglobales bacterium]|nr:Panacea domain-containing protein [Terriglobales bacterium]